MSLSVSFYDFSHSSSKKLTTLLVNSYCNRLKTSIFIWRFFYLSCCFVSFSSCPCDLSSLIDTVVSSLRYVPKPGYGFAPTTRSYTFAVGAIPSSNLWVWYRNNLKIFHPICHPNSWQIVWLFFLFLISHHKGRLYDGRRACWTIATYRFWLKQIRQ